MLSEKGFSLIEVLVSLTILSVSVIGISQFFMQANQISAGNNSKLVATNLARMTLERVQHDYASFEVSPAPKVYSKTDCKTASCQNLYENMVNNTVYAIKIEVKNQSGEESSIKLFPVKVTIQYTNNQKIKSTAVEGYIKDAN
ncbi:prepilin-type N-terminal cleavage/methylation domain-containing protein [Fictibacillus nanhaiensis]|uniref:type IV pilus modification PilV family protein n=1 Tax=Fictibacillus nanhaiensis TaxID=742169 RepID=UPI001C94EAEC|nr:prepilin-type N-terminal cleavage/methylation domain-containing protein [Fictibacillus nanhaiensis]MBY6037051.1 prepilin-type N-terminal cleavage/methylation domain-containing protein [Fictibacillus nanhaiensis]